MLLLPMRHCFVLDQAFEICTPLLQLGEASSLGVFLFLEFQEMMIILMLVLSLLKIYPWVVNARGNGCEHYSTSCDDTFLIHWSLENASDHVRWADHASILPHCSRRIHGMEAVRSHSSIQSLRYGCYF